VKFLSSYTVRGKLPVASVERIQLFDGRFDTGFRVTSFRIWPKNAGPSNDVSGILATDVDALTGSTGNDAGDQRQIGWAASAVGSQTFEFGEGMSILDPDNMIIEDLYIQLRGADVEGNYLITMEKYDISEWQGALCMVRNQSQG
jgi:hypothetical protein